MELLEVDDRLLAENETTLCWICPLDKISPHFHLEECYDQDGFLICESEEIRLHARMEDCWDEDGNLICGQLSVLEHVHTERCRAVSEPVRALKSAFARSHCLQQR